MRVDIDTLLAANPFPGLRAFETAESDRFFGRREQIDALVQQLASSTFLAVAGASGCGKSSLVKAGLLNELQRLHQQAGGTLWLPVVMRPGSRPIESLAVALDAALAPEAPAATESAAELGAPSDPHAESARRVASLYGRLRLGGLALLELVRLTPKPAGARVLVVVDQFEELFRYKSMSDQEEAAAFVKLLLQAAFDAHASVSVILTLRSDTLGSCADFPGLAEAASRGGYLVPRLNRLQRKEAIVGPIELRSALGAKIAPRLVQRLLADVSSDFDDLPVMQHVLSRVWCHWAQTIQATNPEGEARAIDIEDYEAVGGAQHALSNHADEACRSLKALGATKNAQGQAVFCLVERIFRALTERLSEGVEVRRPIEFERLCAVCGASSDADKADVMAVLERFRRQDTAFLQPSPAVDLASNPVIDISHESLIRQWQQLRHWVKAEADARDELLRLLDDAQPQQESSVEHGSQDHSASRFKGEYWHGRDLARAQQWLRLREPNAAWVRLCTGVSELQAEADFANVREFLAHSEAAEARGRALRRWKNGLIKGLLVGIFAISLMASAVFVSQKHQVESQVLASRALLEVVQDPARSALLALKAVEGNPKNDRAEFALRRAMALLEVARVEKIVQFGYAISDARFSADRKTLVIAGGMTVATFDVDSLQEIKRLEIDAGPKLDKDQHQGLDQELSLEKVWLHGEQQLIVHLNDGRVLLRAWDGARNAQHDLSCTVSGKHVISVAYAKATVDRPAQMAVGCDDGELLLWELFAAEVKPAKQVLQGPSDHPLITSALSFSGDGQFLASGHLGGQVKLWRHGRWLPDMSPAVAAKGAKNSVPSDYFAVRDLSFSRSPKTEEQDKASLMLSAASDDGKARIWRLDFAQMRLLGKDPEFTLAHEHSVTKSRFVDRADCPSCLVTVSGRRVFVWKNEKEKIALSHDDTVSEVRVNEDSEILASSSADGTARLWSTRTDVPVAVLRGHTNTVTRALFDHSGRVLTISLDGTFRAWRIDPPRLLAAGKSAMNSLTLSSAGAVLLCGERKDGPEVTPCNFRSALGLRHSVDEDTSGQTSAGFGKSPPPRSGGRSTRDASAWQSNDAISSVQFSSDKRLFLAHYQTDDIYQEYRPMLFKMPEAELLDPFSRSDTLFAVFNPGADEVALLSTLGEVKVWPLSELESAGDQGPSGVAKLTLPREPSRRGVALSPDGQWIASIDGKDLRLWDRRQKSAEADFVLQGHRGDLRSLEFSPDSTKLVSTSTDRTARIWDLRRAERGKPLPFKELRGGHAVALTSAKFSPDSARVVTSAAEPNVRVWNAETGKEMAVLLFRHKGKVNEAIFDTEGERILSVSDDGTALSTPCTACKMPLAELQKLAPQWAQIAEPESLLGRDDSSAWRNLLRRIGLSD